MKRLINIIKKNFKNLLVSISKRDFYIMLVSLFIGILISFVFMEPSDHNMGSAMDSMTSSLKGKSGKDLEKEFLNQMIVHHKGAVEMSKYIIENKTENTKIFNMASKIIKAQEREIEDMEAWLKVY